MKERPLLFSAPMVRAVLDGSKTQTRRVVKPDPGPYWNPTVGLYNPTVIANGGYEAPGPEIFGASDETLGRKCPYGQPDDRLWVRETFCLDDNGYNEWPVFRADGVELPTRCPTRKPARWVPSIHMPRWASRILLETVSVRVERLNDISEADARAEGATGGHGVVPSYHYNATPSEHFSHIWEAINGSGSWKDNPWVWVIEFKRVTP